MKILFEFVPKTHKKPGISGWQKCVYIYTIRRCMCVFVVCGNRDEAYNADIKHQRQRLCTQQQPNKIKKKYFVNIRNGMVATCMCLVCTVRCEYARDHMCAYSASTNIPAFTAYGVRYLKENTNKENQIPNFDRLSNEMNIKMSRVEEFVEDFVDGMLSGTIIHTWAQVFTFIFHLVHGYLDAQPNLNY